MTVTADKSGRNSGLNAKAGLLFFGLSNFFVARFKAVLIAVGLVLINYRYQVHSNSSLNFAKLVIREASVKSYL